MLLKCVSFDEGYFDFPSGTAAAAPTPYAEFPVPATLE